MMPRLWLFACLSILAVSACSKHNGSATPDASNACGVYGTACGTGADCCSAVCDPSGACAANSATCSLGGASCSANTDCCTVSCIANVCSGTQCVADNGACTQGGECCGGTCTNNTCVPLNGSCKTDGNPCGAAGDCCSQFCNSSGLCGPSSFCTQNGDACAHDAECCGGICNIASGNTLGTCSQPMPGSTNCSAGIDGTVCSGCNGCCSRLCEIYPPTGVTICQPAEGCRVDGDLCRVNGDCCGAAGSGLPGDGHVTCNKVNPTDVTGICRNPMSCNPEGDVCHYKNYGTCGNSSARNDCCGGLGNSGVCQLDPLGVPRCFGLGTGCQMAGQSCSNSLDCCNGTPCVQNGMGQFVCGAGCVMTSGTCTQTADCCNGATCVFTPGQTYGACGPGGTCQAQGQTCNAALACCANAGTCTDSTTGVACGATQTTGCTCFVPIF